MSDEPTAVEAPQGEAVAVESPPVPETATTPETPPAPTPRTWQEELDSIDPAELRKHRRFQGILGEELSRRERDVRAQIAAEENAKALDQAQENLRRMAREDPASFAEHWLTEDFKNKTLGEMQKLRSGTAKEIAVKLGQAYNDLPEWKELSAEERQSLTDAVLAVQDEGGAISVFNKLAFDIVAKRRAEKRLAEWKEKELAKERDAIRQEEAAKALKDSEAPDMAKGKGRPSRVDINTLPQDEFDSLWEKMKRGGR